MKELNKKVFITIFGILTFFLFISMLILNIQGYKREYQSIRRNLDIMDERGGGFRPPVRFDNMKEFDIENMMIMDHEVYTIEISNGSISRILGHGNESGNFEVENVANDIMKNYDSDTIKIGNLYTDSYCFNYKTDNAIVLIHISDVNKKMRLFLGETILIFIGLMLVIFILAKQITKWITNPAKEAFDKQREFIADASHELKTPLAVIMASSDELKVDSESERYMENIKYETDRMSKLISALLDLSKIEEGVSRSQFKEENISKIVEKQSLVFEGVAFEQGVLVDADITDNITLNCNKDEIEKLVSTLIDNAIKHSFKDNTVQINLKKVKNSTVLEVSNVGNPIKKGDEEKIFERFYRSDESRNRSDNRYGLGLAIAKGIVLNHGGTISAKSENDKTTFKVVFPH
ncbi:MAG: HAMP domain-containing histidine kinase [Lachnospiraceae bacterium]|nr:HAMP domain-containing histidine kinase [Lachnospiraceae bacterium]